MNRVEFPAQDALLDTDLLRRFQTTWETLQAITGLGGTGKFILTGCERNVNNISNGYVSIEGEVLEFRGGADSGTVIIREDQIPVSSGGAALTQINRYVEFGSGTGSFAFKELEFNRMQRPQFNEKVVISGWDWNASNQESIFFKDVFPDGNNGAVYGSDKVDYVVGFVKNILTGNSNEAMPYTNFWVGSASGLDDGIHCRSSDTGSSYDNVNVELYIYYR